MHVSGVFLQGSQRTQHSISTEVRWDSWKLDPVHPTAGWLHSEPPKIPHTPWCCMCLCWDGFEGWVSSLLLLDQHGAPLGCRKHFGKRGKRGVSSQTWEFPLPCLLCCQHQAGHQPPWGRTTEMSGFVGILCPPVDAVNHRFPQPRAEATRVSPWSLFPQSVRVGVCARAEP